MRLLLDEHVSPSVANGLIRAGVQAVALRDWRGGRHLEAPDDTILAEAVAERYVLVTYDQRTVPALLKLWAETGRSHAGVVFVDHRTVPPNDIGGLVRALSELADRLGTLNWTDRVVFLQRRDR